MLSKLLNFEIRYQSKQRTLPIAGLLFFLLGIFMGRAGNAPALVDYNAPFQISFYSGNFSLMSVFIIMFFAVSGVLRDDKYKMEALIFSSSLSKRHFFISRFIGVFGFSLLAFSLFLPGFLVGISLGDLDAARVAPFRWRSYWWPIFVIILPNIFICTSVLFSASLLSKSNVVVYATAILLYILYFVVGIASNSPMFATSVPASPEQMRLAALLDPFAISTFFEHTQYWTPFEKSSSFLSFSGNYFWNRLLWLTFSLVILGLTYRFFSFQMVAAQRKKRTKASAQTPVTSPYQAIPVKMGVRSQWTAFGASTIMDIKAIVRSLPFLAILFLLLTAIVFELYVRYSGSGYHEGAWYPYSHLVIESVVEIIPILSKILIIFYSAELVWRAKEREFDLIINATPAFNWVFFFSKLAVLFLLPMLLIVILILVCIAFQLLHGFTNIAFGPYLMLFYQYGIPALLFSIVALFIQSLTKHKYLGMGLTGLVILVLSTSIAFNVGIEHPMLRLGYMPTVHYSHMAGYGIQLQAMAHYAWYWVALGILLSILSLKIWNRQLIEVKPIIESFKLGKWKRSELIAFGMALISFIMAASILYDKIHAEEGYQNTDTKADYAEQYERRFKQYQQLPKLSYTAIKTEVDLFPAAQKYTVAADYLLINRQEVPIKQVFITESKQLKEIKLENAKLVFKDSKFGTYLFEFVRPILPQETVRLQFQVNQQSLPFRPDYTISQNGTYLRHELFDPVLGYQKSYELSDPQERKKRGLVNQESLDEVTLKRPQPKTSKQTVAYETIVSTSANQTALASGNLIAKWAENGRNYYQYQYPEENVPVLAYLSAKYDQISTQHRGIDIDYFYHPAHTANHSSIAASTSTTLAYCLDQFGNYPLDHLRIAEMPSFFPYPGTAQPGLIGIVEDQIPLIDLNKPGNANLVASQVAKLVAHQWWGMALRPKQAPGTGLLTAGLTEYTAAVILKKMYGFGALWEQNKKFNETYFRGRTFTNTPEPPLYQEMRENYLLRGKSGLVLLAIWGLIGETQLNVVLRQLIDQQATTDGYVVGIQDFLEELYKVSLAEHHQLIDEWMKQIIRYDLKVEQVDYQPLADGHYEITATIAAQRFKTLDSGQETSISINEPIQLGLFADHPKNLGQEERPIYLQSHQIEGNNTIVKLVVDTLPQYISIDPFLTRPDRNYADNLKVIVD